MGDLTIVAILSVLAGIAVTVAGSLSSKSLEKKRARHKTQIIGAAVAANSSSSMSKMTDAAFPANEFGSGAIRQIEINSSSFEAAGARR